MTPDCLHNYGAPTRSQVVIAAGIERPPLVIVMARHWLPTSGLPFLRSLCQSVGLLATDDLERQLLVATEAALTRANAPAAAVVASHNVGAEFFRAPMEGSGELDVIERGLGGTLMRDRLLAVAILARTSGKLFLRARSPRFDEDAMGAARAFVRHTFRETE
ncbi:hypothetical protein LBMAG42_50020 [Deltaproteobacteria bacterium]|nr:hypothetical protein LBMAG42_50020 [Deltaproteobacteria bacterium]